VAISKERLAEVVARLRQERDELRLKVHLGTMEAKEEWDELERKWQTLESQLAEAKEEAVQRAREARANVELVADELEAAYRRIREGLRMS
jgi:uncharacterized phage-like protein YoqJ